MSFFFVKNKNLEKTCFKRSGIEHGYLCILGIPSSLGTCNSNNNASHHYYYCFFFYWYIQHMLQSRRTGLGSLHSDQDCARATTLLKYVSFERACSQSVPHTRLWYWMLYLCALKCIFVLIDNILSMAHQYHFIF